MKITKTNAMRILDQHKIQYEIIEYPVKNEIVNTPQALEKINKNPNQVFKTLVTVGKSKQNYVFMVPIFGELDLKQAAKVSNEKSIEMIPLKELLPLTGYIHGGCSPISMKKSFNTFLDSSALNCDTIVFNAGKMDLLIEMKPKDLEKVVKLSFADVAVK